MQVLLSAQVSRLSKISKQALHLGEVATVTTKFLGEIWQIPLDESPLSISEHLIKAGFAFWKSLTSVDQLSIFVIDKIADDIGLPSLSSISSLNNGQIFFVYEISPINNGFLCLELVEIIEHCLSSKEVTEGRVPQRDLLQVQTHLVSSMSFVSENTE